VENGFHMLNKKKIVVTGGQGRFGSVLKRHVGRNYFFPKKNELNILKENSIIRYLKKIKPKYLVHLAGLSRPLVLHEKNLEKSISLNIIGTSNIVIACKKLNVKLIYFSSSYVYPGTKGNYKETDGVKPINNYGLSKMGGEASVLMYKNSLVLRIQMTEKPFAYKKAYTNLYSNYIFHEDVALMLPKLINRFGIINVGVKAKSAYSFASKNS